eukprot:15347_1
MSERGSLAYWLIDAAILEREGGGEIDMTASVNSRKLQSIYNALDACNYSLAVKLCKMKDMERWAVTKALKSYGLARLGHSDEALALAKEVASKAPTDEDTLRALEWSFRYLGASEEIVNVFEAASKAQPNNLSLATAVFVHAAGIGDFLKAQKTALRLYKLSGEKRHVMWAVTAILVQVQLGKNQTMIAVAERMIQKVLGIDPSKDGIGMTTTSKLSGQEIEIYVVLLRKLGKLSDALAILKEAKEIANLNGNKILENNIPIDIREDGIGVSMQHEDRERMMAEIMSELGDFRSASTVYRTLLADHPDQWSYYAQLLEFRLRDVDSPSTIYNCLLPEWELIVDLQKKHPKCREPRLAELELVKLIMGYMQKLGTEIIEVPAGIPWCHTTSSNTSFQLEFENSPAGALCDIILQYMSDFATKPSVFQDLKLYLEALLYVSPDGPRDNDDPTYVLKLLYYLQEEWKSLRKAKDWSLVSKEEGMPQDQRLLGMLVHNAEVRWYLNRLLASINSTRDEEEGKLGGNVTLFNEVKQLCELYLQTKTIAFSEQEGAEHEIKQVDTLIILGVEVLSKAACLVMDCSPERAFLLHCEAAAMLEIAHDCQPHNFIFKVAAIEVYRKLGSFNKAIELLKRLDIKNIQLDSLGWMIFPGCLRCGYFKEALYRTNEVMRMHLSCKEDVARNVGIAFKWGNYMQVIDMKHFQEVIMGRSMQLALAKIECAGLELLLMHHSLHVATTYLQHLEMGMLSESIQLSDAELERLSDNMDFSVASSFQLPQESTFKKKTRRERFHAQMDIKQRTWRFFRKALQGSKATEDLQALTLSIEALREKDTDKFAKENWILLLCLARALQAFNGGGDEEVRAHSMEQEHLGGSSSTIETSMLLSNLLQEAQRYAENIRLRFVQVPHMVESSCQLPNEKSAFSLPFDPQWLAGACKMMLDVGTAIGLALQALSPLLRSSGTTSSASKSDGRKKKSKGKRRGGSGGGNVLPQQPSGNNDGGELRTPVAVNGSDPGRQGNKNSAISAVLLPSQALQSLGSTWMSVLKDLVMTLKSEIQGKEDAHVTSTSLRLALKQNAVALPHQSCTECSQALDKVAEDVLQGQARGAEQLLDIVKAKRNVLQSIYV